MTKKFTKDHEWVQIQGNVITLGITEYAAQALGELVYVELPKVGQSYNKGDAFAVVESSKSASDVYIPVNGEVVEVNNELTSKPELVNNSSYQDGWIAKIKVSDTKELEGEMSQEQYDQYLKENH